MFEKTHRIRLGILFNFNVKWTGGIIYNLNIIKTLNFLEEKDKLTVVVLYNPALKKYIDEIEYPYLELVPHNFSSIYKGYVDSILKNKNVFVHDLVINHKLDAIFPMHDYPVKSKLDAKLVSWYADLQHMYYPQFFTKRKRLERNARIKLILKNSKDLVVSSQAVKDDFIKFFKLPKTLNVHIYHFVSIIEGLPDMTFDEIRAKYNLPEHYYMISNQFHKHKNHKVVFEAVAELKKKGIEVSIGITGRFPDQPDSPYMQELHDIINKNNLKKSIKFLGLIPRGDQLLLMKYCKAILQPSLFEGWSTVIEDAKSLQVPVIAANLDVNIEQLQEKGTYHEPHNVAQLVSIMENYPNRDYTKQLYDSYDSRMKAAAYELLSVFK
ncbi:MAG TPA: glycosyltransferase family 1 protein [Flavobacterium sp.]|uniref:glycosyltransferase family 4 protein n=1 Tax=Flavobacterium sp. TaxID=239 RepID=UPI002D15E05C|nr:glycosyltransferase family 1 protein [Flavobacterium sp.]HNP34082.1 glycosyltransferase family 1 protein [Flavobacterium sp.]